LYFEYPAGGLPYTQAAVQLTCILNEARRRKLTGVALKEYGQQPEELERSCAG